MYLNIMLTQFNTDKRSYSKFMFHSMRNAIPCAHEPRRFGMPRARRFNIAGKSHQSQRIRIALTDMLAMDVDGGKHTHNINVPDNKKKTTTILVHDEASSHQTLWFESAYTKYEIIHRAKRAWSHTRRFFSRAWTSHQMCAWCFDLSLSIAMRYLTHRCRYASSRGTIIIFHSHRPVVMVSFRLKQDVGCDEIR